MATTEDIARLRLETVGAETLDTLRSKLSAVQAEMGDLAAAYARGEVAQRDFDGQVRLLADSHTSLSRGLKDLGGGLDNGQSKLAGFGQAGLQTGRAIQDFYQGGVLGILNNIEGVVQSLGGGAGVAGILTAFGVGLTLLMPQIKEFFASLQGDTVDVLTTHLDRLKGQIEELEDKPHKVAVDVLALDAARDEVERIKAALEAVDKLSKSRGYYEKESGQQIEETFAESAEGGAAIKDALRTQIVREQMATSPALQGAQARSAELESEQRRLEAARDAALDPESKAAFEMQLTRLQMELNQTRQGVSNAQTAITRRGGSADEALGTLLNQAENGTGLGQRTAQTELSRRLRQSGRGDLAESVGLASPENLQAQDQEEEAFNTHIEDRQKAAQAQAKRNKEKADANEKELKRLAKQRDDSFKEVDNRFEKQDKESDQDQEKGRDAEAKEIQDTLGKQRQQEYEILVAQNQARLTGGAPVARTAAEEQQLRGMNAAYALPPDVLARRLQGQLAQEFQQRGAAPGSAQQAAGAIAGAGQQDLQRRAAQFSGSTLNLQQQALMLTHELTQGYAQMNTHLQSLDREVKQQRAMVRNAHRRAR